MKLKNNFLDIWNIVLLRLKLLLTNKKLIILYIFFIVLSASIMLTFSKEAEEKSSIPIGIVDLDNTDISRTIINRLSCDETIRVVKGSRDDLLKKLETGEVYSVFVYEKGFSKKLLELDTSGIINHIYPKDAMFGQIISDIVLSPMLDDVCYLYCRQQYYHNEKRYIKISTKDEYENYFRNLYQTESKKVSFDFKVISNQVRNSDKLKTKLLYFEIIIGISAILIILVSMIIGNIFIDDYIKGVHKRLYISTMKTSSILLGDFLASVVVSAGFGTIVSVILFKELEITKFNQIIKLLLLIWALECTISMLFVLLSRACKDFVAYQLIGSMCVLILGISGAVYILGFLVDKSISNKLVFAPVATLINGYKNIIVGGDILNNLFVFLFEIVAMYIIAYLIEYKNKSRLVY